MAITKKTEYAIRALCEVARSPQGKPVTRKQISAKENISETFLEQIFIPLQKAHIIKSIRGPGGGFVLNRNDREITVWDIYTAVENTEYLYDKCYLLRGEKCEHSQPCATKYLWPKLNEIMKTNMSAITLDDIVRGQIKPGKPMPPRRKSNV